MSLLNYYCISYNKSVKNYRANLTRWYRAFVVFQWVANPVNDMYADAVLAVILQVESNPTALQGE